MSSLTYPELADRALRRAPREIKVGAAPELVDRALRRVPRESR